MAKIAFTAGRINGFRCPPEKLQAFLWDATAKGLGLRGTVAGKSSYVFQGVYQGKDIRITIGRPDAWSIPKAQEKARELQRQIDEGHDPRGVKRKALAAASAEKVQAAAQAVTVGDVWPRFLLEGRPKRKEAWKPRYAADLAAMSAPGGLKKKRGKGTTRAGPLYPLLSLTLNAVTEDSLKAWFDSESASGPHQATRSLMMFRGFLRWCSARPEYRTLIDRNAGRAPAIVESLPQVTSRTDCIETAQLAGWFSGVDVLANRSAAAYLITLLMTGARREEIGAMKWTDIDFRWKKLTLKDKVDLTRTIPLSAYLEHILQGLTRVNKYVFASGSQSGHLVDARASLAKVRSLAEINKLTFHGLRRSYALLGEAAGAPDGAIAQVMGHKPSATAEGYRPRSLDALRPFVAQIEAHILKEAGIAFPLPLIVNSS